MPNAIIRYAATIADIREAAIRIAPYIHRTPVMTCATIDRIVGRSVFFKCENFQKIGAFKMRGATNAIMKLPPDVAQRGVVTHSSGNHAQAVALAARLWGARGIPAHIVMPCNSTAVKRRAVEGYGAKVHLCEPNQAARESTAARIVQETGATLIPSYNHPDVIAGQGTAALELLEQTADQGGLDAIIAPIGGGGLMAGTCVAAAIIGSSSHQSADLGEDGRRIHIIGAEPAGADDAARSLAAGQLIPQTNPKTIADGLRTSMGDLTWPIIRDHVERVITASDEQIIAAMRLGWERMKIIIEPSSAVAVHAVLSDAFKQLPPEIQRVGVILSGGNVDLDQLPW